MPTPPVILTFSPVVPHPAIKGNRARVMQVGWELKKRGYRLVLLSPKGSALAGLSSQPWDAGYDLNIRPNWKPSRANAPLDSWYSERLGTGLRNVVQENQVNVVWFHYPFHSKALENLDNSVIKIIDTHDTFSSSPAQIFGDSTLRVGHRNFFQCEPSQERIYLNRADLVIAITDVDAQYFKELGVESRILTLPYQQTKSARGNPAKRQTDRKPIAGVVLSANEPNRQALLSLVKAIEKKYGAHPPFTVKVAGDIRSGKNILLFPPALFRKRTWLNYCGPVDKLEDFFSSLDFSIAPTLWGTGVSVKFADAVSAGVPTLATAIGSRGSNSEHPLHLFHSLDELVAKISELTNDVLIALLEYQKALTRANAKIWQRCWIDMENFLNLGKEQ